jgi:hypothetical protein
MALRVVHIINGECDIFLQKSRDIIKIHVSENPASSSPDPTDFELEGSVPALRELISTLNTVMSHADAISEEMN